MCSNLLMNTPKLNPRLQSVISQQDHDDDSAEQCSGGHVLLKHYYYIMRNDLSSKYISYS